jgi:hypothetical protein
VILYGFDRAMTGYLQTQRNGSNYTIS